MNYWKLGCNWGRGKPDFYPLLFQNRLVICGEQNITRGDWVLIFHGYNCDALAHVATDPVPCTNRPELRDVFGLYEIDYEAWNLVADCDTMYELHENEKFQYSLQKGIRRIRKPDVIQKAEIVIRTIQGETMIKEMIKLLGTAKQIVLTGAPGTGKTYLARQIARSMVLNDVEKQLPESEIEKLLADRVKLVQFHPSYDYTDFVEGLRPIQGVDGQVGFKRQDGAFKKLCKAAIAAGECGGVDNFDDAWTRFIDDLKECYSSNNPLELTTPKSDCTFKVFANRKDNLSGCSGKCSTDYCGLNCRTPRSVS